MYLFYYIYMCAVNCRVVCNHVYKVYFMAKENIVWCVEFRLIWRICLQLRAAMRNFAKAIRPEMPFSTLLPVRLTFHLDLRYRGEYTLQGSIFCVSRWLRMARAKIRVIRIEMMKPRGSRSEKVFTSLNLLCWKLTCFHGISTSPITNCACVTDISSHV